MKKILLISTFILTILIFSGISLASNSSQYSTINVNSLSKTQTYAPHLIKPSNLVYKGAFRFPDESGWEYGGSALAYYVNGDPVGTNDGYSGSIFATGHDWYQKISEISIPRPVISTRKNVNDLPKAKTLQKFTDIKDKLFGYLEIPRVGLEYLPRQGLQNNGKLYYCWGQHMQEGQKGPSHGWFELNLRHPKIAGPWRMNGLDNYVTCGYIFSIPRSWANIYTPKMLLATGRFRDGGQGSCGPSIFAYGPWNHGNPPNRNSIIKTVPLLLYDSVYSTGKNYLKNYHHSDEWTGGAWLGIGGRSAVIFAGTKGTGTKYWYGFANGVVWPDHAPYPSIPSPPNNERGWWSKTFQGQIIFYDPIQLTKVVKGQIKRSQPQPYAVLNIDPYLFKVKNNQQKNHVKGITFDRAHGILYIIEPMVDGDKPIVHVWKLR